MKIGKKNPQSEVRSQEKRIFSSLIVVSLFGILLGYFVWKSAFTYTPHSYPISFEYAQWITSPSGSPQAYFRKEIFVHGYPVRTWIKIAASDSYILYINGRKIDKKRYLSLNVSGIYDISSYLQSGKNIIAVEVDRKSYPGGVQLAVEGGFSMQMQSSVNRFISDGTWKVASNEERQGKKAITWYAKKFDDINWVNARLAGKVIPGEVSPVDIRHELITTPPKGKWIGHPDPTVRRILFVKRFEVPGRIDDAWLRVAASTQYDLIVNGIKIITKDKFENRLDIYRIAPLIKKGLNTIGIGINGNLSSPYIMADGDIFMPDGVKIGLKTDTAWKIYNSTDKGVDSDVVILTPSNSEGEYLPKVRRDLELSLSYTSLLIERSKMVITISIILAIILILWMVSALILSKIRNKSWSDMLFLDALIHLLPFIALLFIFLLRYDIRYDPSYPFESRFILISLFILIFSRVVLIIEQILYLIFFEKYKGNRFCFLSNERIRNMFYKWIYIFALLCIVTMGFYIRFYDLGYLSYTHDEASMVKFAKGILTKGYPYKTIGPIEKPLTTYELVPYPIALSMGIFGMDEFGARLPSLFFGTITIIIIGITGARLFDKRVGILASVIYAFLPWAIKWSQNTYHPQQTQLFALLTIFFIYLAVSESDIKPKYLYLGGISFIISYLSWEGVGFMLPALLCAVAAIKGKELSWLKNKHLWLTITGVGMGIFLQQARRLSYQIPYIVVGTGTSDVTLPSLFFLDSMYDPYFYINNFLLIENHVVMTLLLIIGIPFLIYNKAHRYLYVTLFSVLFMMTGLIPNHANRHVYFLLPVLILLSTSILFSLIDIISQSKEGSISIFSRISGIAAMSSLAILLFLTTNTRFLKLYKLSSFPSNPIFTSRMNIYSTDYRTTGKFIQTNFQKGDIIISNMSHTIEYYSDKRPDYYLQMYTDRRVFYDISKKDPNYLDRYVGGKVIRSLNELLDVLNRHKRVWIVATNDRIFRSVNDNEIIRYIKKNSTAKNESTNTIIYLWNR